MPDETDFLERFLNEEREGFRMRVRDQQARHQRASAGTSWNEVVDIQAAQDAERLEGQYDAAIEEGNEPVALYLRYRIDELLPEFAKEEKRR